MLATTGWTKHSLSNEIKANQTHLTMVTTRSGKTTTPTASKTSTTTDQTTTTVSSLHEYDYKFYPTIVDAVANGFKDTTDNTYCYAEVLVVDTATPDKNISKYYINFTRSQYDSLALESCDLELYDVFTEFVESNWSQYCLVNGLDKAHNQLWDDVIVYNEPIFDDIHPAVDYLADRYRTRVSETRYKEFIAFVYSTEFHYKDGTRCVFTDSKYRHVASSTDLGKLSNFARNTFTYTLLRIVHTLRDVKPTRF